MSTKVKFILTYFGGFVTGVIFILVLGVFVNAVILSQKAKSDESDKGDVTLFDKPKVTIEADGIEVLQVLSDGSALAMVRYSDKGNNDNLGMTVMLLAKEGVSYFDSQSIKISRGKCMKQIGTYKYEEFDSEKTVPIVEIFDK